MLNTFCLYEMSCFFSYITIYSQIMNEHSESPGQKFFKKSLISFIRISINILINETNYLTYTSSIRNTGHF